MQIEPAKDICLTKKGVLYLKEKVRWLDRLSDELDLAGENPPGQPIIEVAGERRVLIERHRGVVQYGSDQICVKVKYGLIRIQGSCLEIVRMTREQLVISGRIDAVILCRRE